MKSNRGRVGQLLKYTRLHNEIENKTRVDNQPQLHSEWTEGIKAALVMKFCALLTRDELPWRTNNSANDQDLLQEFLKWSEQITIEFITEKNSFSKLAFDQVTPPFSVRRVFGKLEKVTARRRIVWTIKGI